ncbi:MAG: N-acetylmuramoyl-L-alanine amidase [Vicinamibacteria bacterium]|nr:N-acetylmuramoyl-L-alanine amidase [Vicinamibacteria bacterium]
MFGIASSAAAAEPVLILQEGQARREIEVLVRNGVEMVPLRAVAAQTSIAIVNDARAQTATLSFQNREVTLYHRKSLASIHGDLRLLSAPALMEAGEFLIPIDAVARVFGPLLGMPVVYQTAGRVFILGNVALPSVTVSSNVTVDQAQVVIAASQNLPFRVSRAEGRVVVAITADALDVPFKQERLTGGIIDSVQYSDGREHSFTIALGRRFAELQVQEEAARVVLSFRALPMSLRPAPTPTPVRPPEPQNGIRVVVIDPGHGGAEVGAQGPGGALEKDITLVLARKLRAALVSGLGLQAFMTRDGDRDLSLDDRTAIANNYKADLFISIHANASRSHGARGSEVYFLAYQASDDESRRIAQLEGGAEMPKMDGGAPSSTDLSLVLWDMAQADHLAESSALASRIQEELGALTGSEIRGVKQAPFRVLVGAAMPAVLVETAFISNPEEEKQLLLEKHQNDLVAAMVRGIARFDQEHVRRLGPIGASKAQ